jgi:putative Mn2+ efflux pump MntP
MWDIMFFVNSIFLGVGLAMDAFSVSLANGMNEPLMKRKKMFLIAGVFGVFQALMPLIGWALVNSLVYIFGVLEKFIPWIALVLLTFIGVKMIVDGVKSKEENECLAVGLGALLVQGIATSIDALSVGFTIADYDLLMAVVASVIIMVVTTIKM